jgi:IgA Peptidase M64
VGTADGTVVGTTKVVDNGANNERYNLVVLGDGFRSTEQSAYEAAVSALVAKLQAAAPFDAVWSNINVHRVDVHSNQSGADDPTTCSGGTGATANTYFDAAFCNNNIRRLLVVNDSLVLSTAGAQVPEWHAILVVVNSTIYGGSGGQVAVYSLASGADEIALHELGHSAFGLADEYEYYAGCQSGETDRNNHPGGEPSEPNVTTNTDRATLKWRHLVNASTPLPTTANANCSQCDTQAEPAPVGRVGLFEGARYYHCKAYRPVFDCRMRTLGRPFCPVCQERIRERITMGRRSGNCFIATAVYRDQFHPDVAALRAFRDAHLAEGAPWRRVMIAVVAVYRRVGPPLARLVARHPAVSRAIRQSVLRPLVAVLRARVRSRT